MTLHWKLFIILACFVSSLYFCKRESYPFVPWTNSCEWFKPGAIQIKNCIFPQESNFHPPHRNGDKTIPLIQPPHLVVDDSNLATCLSSDFVLTISSAYYLEFLSFFLFLIFWIALKYNYKLLVILRINVLKLLCLEFEHLQEFFHKFFVFRVNFQNFSSILRIINKWLHVFVNFWVFYSMLIID